MGFYLVKNEKYGRDPGGRKATSKAGPGMDTTPGTATNDGEKIGD